MDDQRMTFGRYRGTPLALVPVEYLAWAAERMQNLPGCVMAELTRRAEQRETRDSIVAQSALSGRLFPRPKKRRRNHQRDWWYARAAGHHTKAHRGRGRR